MNLGTCFFAVILSLNLLISCTSDDSVEEGIQAESNEYIATGDNGTPIDDDEL